MYQSAIYTIPVLQNDVISSNRLNVVSFYAKRSRHSECIGYVRYYIHSLPFLDAILCRNNDCIKWCVYSLSPTIAVVQSNARYNIAEQTTSVKRSSGSIPVNL